MRAKANESIAEDLTSRELSGSVNASAFLGTNPTDELITPGFPVIRQESAQKSRDTFARHPCRLVEIFLRSAAKNGSCK